MRSTATSKRFNSAAGSDFSSPASEITLRLWSLSDCTSRIRTPETLPSASTMAFTTSARRPSLMLGTDSMILGMAPPVSPQNRYAGGFFPCNTTPISP